MYIRTKEERYPCQSYRAGADASIFVLKKDTPEELGDTVELWAEDGFLMASQRVADWLRWEVSGNFLILTDAPKLPIEPEPEPDPEPTTDDLLNILLGVT